MSAIFGFTFHIGRMTEVLTPDIYRAHWLGPRMLNKKLIFSRKNPVHFQEYSHDQESDNSEEEKEEEKDDLPECPYGEYCYRKNPRHRREYKHTPRKLS